MRRIRSLPILLSMAVLLTLSGKALAAEDCTTLSATETLPTAAQQWRIAKILFARNDIFDLNNKHSVWFHRFANEYHVITSESALREDLLFQEGDRLDQTVLAETERLLRARRYLRHAEITISAYCPASQTVQVASGRATDWATATCWRCTAPIGFPPPKGVTGGGAPGPTWTLVPMRCT